MTFFKKGALLMVLKINIKQFSYGNNIILQDIDKELSEPRIIGLVAPNGIGKSTFLNLVSGQLTPSQGSITYKGVEYQNNRTFYNQNVVMMPDQADLYDDLSGRDHLSFYANMWDIDKTNIDSVIKDLKMEDYVNNKVATYSLGMRQRLAFALVLITQARVMLLDEVMNGLDPSNVVIISNILKKQRDQGSIIIMASHLLDNLEEISDEIYFIKDKKLLVEHQTRDEENNIVTIEFNDIEAFEKTKELLENQQITYTQQNKEINISLLFEPELFDKINDLAHRIIIGPKSVRKIYNEIY